MLERIRKSFNEGVNSVKWVATFFAERLKAETSIAKLLYASSKLEARIDALYRDIGKRVMELKEKKEEKSISKDFIILQAIEEIKKLKAEIDDYKSKAHALSKPSDTFSPTE